MKKILILIIVALILAGGYFVWRSLRPATVPVVVTPTPTLSTLYVSAPSPQEIITSPFTITGEARGNWFFEASFPIQVIESTTGHVITTTIATAHGDWMTTSSVPFSAPLTFLVNTTTPATIIFKADNPSGLPQNDKSFSVPVLLAP